MTDWFKSLKAGDEVAIRFGDWKRSEYLITRVERVTPSGIVKVRSYNGIEVAFVQGFGDEGRERGAGYNISTLVKVTPEVRDCILRNNAISVIRAFEGSDKLAKLSTEVLVKMATLLSPEEKP